MKRISKWLENKFFRHSAAFEADERHTPVDKYVSHDTITQPVLRIRKESSYIVIETPSFDPYNSGSFDKSNLRKSSSRK